jgi:glyoxylase-like metal-dependent hydrolase (beta-lactamase superfamily II)
MKIYHLNCGTLYPAQLQKTKALFDRKIPLISDGLQLFEDTFQTDVSGNKDLFEIACHVLLIEIDNDLLLIDTGFGTQFVDYPNESFHSPLHRQFFGLNLELKDTAFHQIKKLNLDPGNVTDIILTHLDIDHVGGLKDFPNARVHVAQEELDAANSNNKRLKPRYDKRLWSHGPKWETYPLQEFKELGPIKVSPPLNWVNGKIRLVDFHGHTPGHCGVLIQQETKKDILFCGDAFLNFKQLKANYRKVLLIEAYNKLFQHDQESYKKSFNLLKKNSS